MPDTPHNKPDRRPSEAAYWFLFDRDRLLLRHNTDGWYIPLAAEPPVEAAAAMEITGQVARTTPGPEPASNTIRYFASSVEVPQAAPAGMEWVALRASYDLLGERVYALAGKAFAGLQRIGGVIETMAAAEGLGAHKNAVTLRLRKLE